MFTPPLLLFLVQTMTDYRAEWLRLIALRDNYYLMAFLLMAIGLFWFSTLRRRVKRLFRLAAALLVLLVIAAWVWGLGILWSV